MNSSTDHQLMLAVRDGEVDKLGRLFEQYHIMLYNFFLQQTSSRETSEDLVQEVFLRILKYRHTYRGEGKFTTWMFSIAYNTKIDHYRKHKHHTESLEETDTIASQDPNPEDVVKQENESAILQRALSRLSPEKRDVLILSRFQNMRYEEIAKIMNSKVGTIKARVFRAIRELSKIYLELTETKRHEM